MKKSIILRKNGKDVSYSENLEYIISLITNGLYQVTIAPYREKRTLNQNALMWLWFACIERETGTPKDDIYMYYCKKFLSRIIEIMGKEEKVYKTSSLLYTDEMTHFMKKIQADAASELGITLPLPGDRFYNDFTYTFKK